MSEPRRGAVTLEGPGHPVVVGRGALERVAELASSWAPAHRYAIVADSHVAPLYAGKVENAFAAAGALVDTFTFPAGEEHKTRDTWAVLTDEMLTTGFGRDSAVIALGGGVTGDLAGFVAATYMRGIPVIQVPTTLMAMVDSAIGGKTGVDTPAGKNLVGSFHLPAGVVADPEVLHTLPLRQVQAGLAEILKYGAVADAAYFREVAGALPALLAADATGGDRIHAFIVRSIEIKSEIVRSDVREAGRRKILNFGHTLGHAIEAASGYSMLHGEAIAVGMIAESAAAERAGIADAGTSDAIRAAVASAGLPTTRPDSVAIERVVEMAASDKKSRKGELEFAVPRRVGEMARASDDWTVRLPLTVVKEVLA